MAVPAQWRDLLGAEYELASSYLRPTTKLATSYPRAGNELPFTVIEHGPDDYVGVCPEGGDTITLAKEDLITYELDRRKFQHGIARALGIEHDESDVDGLSGTQRIGTYRPCSGYAFPAYLTIPLEPSDLTQAIRTFAAVQGEPFVLLVPTSRRLRPEAGTVIRQTEACFLPLTDALAVNDRGKWVATPVAQQAIEAFRAAHLPAAENADRVAFFPTPTDAKWSDVSIRFIDGETVSIRVGDISGTHVYGEIGMIDRRSKRPDKQWELLRALAKVYGVLTWNSRDADRNNQKRRGKLATALQQFFRIDGDPIIYDNKAKGWKTLFSVEPDL